jgi:hypothetical protein
MTGDEQSASASVHPIRCRQEDGEWFATERNTDVEASGETIHDAIVNYVRAAEREAQKRNGEVVSA